MRKRIAAAVLAACVNILGTANADALITTDDDDGPDGVDTIEFGKIENQGRQSAVGLAAAAAAASGDPVEKAWVTRTTEGAWAAVTVQRRSPHIAFIDVTTRKAGRPDFALNQLLVRALSFCADHGVLKIVLQPDELPIGSLCRFVESRGFQFSRVRSIDGVDHVEFYRDLYRRVPDAA